MIPIKLPRQAVEDISNYFFPFIRMSKQTRLKNIAAASLYSQQFLSALAINCILDEIILHIKRKELNTTKPVIKMQFTDAQAVILFKTLMELPVNPEQIHLNNLRNELVALLDKELTIRKIYTVADFQKPVKVTGDEWIFDYE